MHLTDDEYRTAYGLVPRLCVDLVIRSDRWLLLVRRKQKPFVGAWHLPGGCVRKGESLDSAVRRIARHELGIDVTVGDQCGVMEFLLDKGDLQDCHSVSVAFLCQPVQRDCGSSGAWFDAFPVDPMHPTHKVFLFAHSFLKEATT